jgi:hypothetical protein
MRSFQEASEFGGGKQSDVAGSPSPDNYRILLVDHLVENAREIFTQTRICCFPGHHAPPTRIVQHSCTAAEILYILVVRPTVFRGCAIVLSQADLWRVIGAIAVHHVLPARHLSDAKFGRTALSGLYYDLYIVPQRDEKAHEALDRISSELTGQHS